MTVHRRDFIQGAVEASIATYLAGMGLGSVAHHVGQRPDGTVCYLGPVSRYVRDYRRPRGRVVANRAQTLRFDVVYWQAVNERTTPENKVIGEVTMKRVPAGRHVVYEIRRRLPGVEELTASITSRLDAWRTPVAWHVEHRSDSAFDRRLASQGLLIQKGRFDGKAIFTKHGKSESRLPVAAPLTSQWGLIDQAGQLQRLWDARRAGLGKRVQKFLAEQGFSLLMEPSGVRSAQKIRRHMTGSPVPKLGPLTAWLQTGPATVPTHWVVDDEGRPLFITMFTTSLALREID